MIHFGPLRDFDHALLGLIPTFLNVTDPRPATEQLNDNYQHGGGWRPSLGFTLRLHDMALLYPGDPPSLPLAVGKLRAEKIYVYESGWVMVLKADQTFEVCRMD